MGKIVALVQARMSSTRFPGKVLEPLGGRPMIVFMIERVRKAALLDEVVVVTSEDPSDDPLFDELTERGLPVFRGELDDVLTRYAAAAEAFDAEVIVRLTGDCPLVDPDLIDRVVASLVESGADYSSNIDPPSFADGLDVEAFTREALQLAHERAREPADREHVTLWLRKDAASLRRTNVSALLDSSDLRITVDYPDDLDVVRRIVADLGDHEPFDRFDVLRYLERNPELTGRNQHTRNEALVQASATVMSDGGIEEEIS